MRLPFRAVAAIIAAETVARVHFSLLESDRLGMAQGRRSVEQMRLVIGSVLQLQ